MKVTYLTIDGEIISETREGVDSDYIPDPLGSTSKLVDTSMRVTDEFLWWPYGELRAHSVGTSATPMGYVGTFGGYRGTGGVYFRERILDDVRTRWATVDPIWPLESNYVYGHANPVTFTDPTGLQVSPYPPTPPNLGGGPWWPKPFQPIWPPNLTLPPITLPPFKFPGVPPFYGNYCGPQNGGFSYPPSDRCRPKPHDALDACCQAHDDCFQRSNCILGNQLRPDCRQCSAALCACAAGEKCGWNPLCIASQNIVLGYACFAGIGSKPIAPR